jgi:hypothetical protein
MALFSGRRGSHRYFKPFCSRCQSKRPFSDAKSVFKSIKKDAISYKLNSSVRFI